MQVDWEAREYLHRLRDKHPDLVERRLLKEATIPAPEKVFSLFEPHTEWIPKGKQRPHVEPGHRLLIATDQNQLIQDHDVAAGVADVDRSVPVADRYAGPLRHWERAQPELRPRLHAGKRPATARTVCARSGDAQTRQVERGGNGAGERKKFKALRRQHSAVESEINSLEHHGLNRCPDVELTGYLPVIGRMWLARAAG